jgi:hypothetical protein
MTTIAGRFDRACTALLCNPVVGSAHPTTGMSCVYVGGQCPPCAPTRLVLETAQIKEVRTIEDHLDEKSVQPHRAVREPPHKVRHDIADCPLPDLIVFAIFRYP